MMNKKAQTKYILLYIVKMIFLIIVITSIIFLIGFYINVNTSTPTLELQTIYNYIYFSSDTINYVDEATGRNYPGLIDIRKINTENFDATLHYSDEKFAAASVYLYSENYPDKGSQIASAISNIKYYNIWFPLSSVDVEGRGSVNKLEKFQPISYRNFDGSIKRGYLKIIVLVPNR